MNVDPDGTFALTTSAILLIIGISALVVGVGAAIYVGVTAYNNGYRGWDLVGAIAGGFVGGAIVGALIGAVIAMFIYAAPAIGSFLGSTFTLGYVVTSSGALVAITVTGAQIAAAGAAAAIGLGIVLAKHWERGTWPGDDPTVSPDDDFEWRGNEPVGGDKGAWHNPHTKESLFPDFNHPEGIAPHWDWTDKFKRVWRIFRNYMERKK